MKIAIDCRFWGPKDTGLGRYTQNLVENLLAIDKKNQYILLTQAKFPISSKILNFKFQIIDINHYSLKEQLVLPFLFRKIKPDLIHFPHFNAPFFSNFPYVVTIHDLIKHYSKGLETTTRHPLIYAFKYLGYKQIFYQTVKRAKKIIVPSFQVKKQLLKEYNLNSKKVVVIYEGVENKFKISNIKNQISNKILENYKIKRPYIVYTGNAYPHKNLRRLILAIKSINQSSSINLVIVCGRDVFWQRLKKTISEFKASRFVSLVGFVSDEDLGVIYNQAKAFVSPSLMEGFGLPGLEAMKAGCPIAVSNIPVFKEIYAKAAIYFSPENVEDMKEKIMKILTLSNKSREKLIAIARKQAEKYSWQKCAQETLKIYRQALS